ncbi:hypothetical protein PROFUN_14205 [Planoprotostelium fungivorum]|uniref:Uncharacterized protein n=1 Tax=Planoprotostelium fungivorum TaxID=1890364 RepID=A0A2P6N0M4_9EUKA|nr:hypothetical protein PROFUN_14205 [Planoprotostelium fungivorum]
MTNWKTRRKVSENSATKKHIQCMFIEKEHLGFLWFEIILYKQRLIELFGSYVATIHHSEGCAHKAIDVIGGHQCRKAVEITDMYRTPALLYKRVRRHRSSSFDDLLLGKKRKSTSAVITLVVSIHSILYSCQARKKFAQNPH